MKFRELKMGVWDRDCNWRGMKKKYVITIVQNTLNGYPYYYFLIDKGDIDFRFNSLWKEMNYNSFEECCKYAEKYLDEEVLKVK